MHTRIKRNKGSFLSFVEENYEILIFTNQSNKKVIKHYLKQQNITSELDNVGYITINWEKSTKDIPGIYYRITRALAFRNISIQAIHTIGSEMTIFFKEDVFVDAYKVIGDLILNKVEI